jgi:hypothetical protein
MTAAKHEKLRPGQKGNSALVELRSIFELIIPRPPQNSYDASQFNSVDIQCIFDFTPPNTVRPKPGCVFLVAP